MIPVNLKSSVKKELPGRTMWMLLNRAEHKVEELSVSYIEIPGQQAALPFHVHEESAEFIYIISGEGHIVCNNKTVDMPQGGAVLLEKGENHALFNDGTDPLCALCVFVPPASPDNYLKPAKS
jgi:mannose-6-phosphate isomerase-like protein (cupin superfamily)